MSALFDRIAARLNLTPDQANLWRERLTPPTLNPRAPDGLSARLLLLTVAFTLAVEALILAPSAASFHERWLPYLLVGPQIIITLVFFFWPSGQAIWQSVLIEDAFGGNSKFVWFENYAVLFANPDYYRSMVTTAVFSTLVALF